jgi:hypothetical protein
MELNKSMNKYIGDFLGFKLFSEQDMPKECLEHMEKKLNSPMELFDIPVGYQYSPFRKPWAILTDEEVKQLCFAVGTEPMEVRLIEAKLKEKNAQAS